MSAEDLLSEIRSLGGRLEADGDRLLIDVPAGMLTPELRERLRQHKADILRKLELEASMCRLHAMGVSIAIWEDGSMRVVVSDAAIVRSINENGTIYSPEDMYHYVTLSKPERRMLHSFKKRFGG